MFFFFKQKTAYEMRISDWSSDVCSSDLIGHRIIAADIEPRARIGRELAAQRPLGLDQRGDAEALGGIEQAVGPVDADLASQAESGIEIADALAAREVVIILARRDELGAIGIGQLFLPQRRRIIAPAHADAAGQRLERIIVAAFRLRHQLEGAVAAPGVRAAKGDTKPLTDRKSTRLNTSH